jgi:aquaporin Z
MHGSILKNYVSEFVGTFLLVLLGPGAAVLLHFYPTGLDNFIIALCFGLAVFLAIYFWGKISGAHINPAVSIAFMCLGKLSLKHTFWYVFSQCLGAIAASLLTLAVFKDPQITGQTFPTHPHSFLLEFSITFGLMFWILFLVKLKTPMHVIAMAVGFYVFLAAFFVGPLTGASMNPARTLGPVVASGQYQTLLLYVGSTILGAVCASIAARLLGWNREV